MSQEQRQEEVLDGLRTAMSRLPFESPSDQDEPPAQSLRRFVGEMQARWALPAEPPGSSLPVIGPLLSRLKHYAYWGTRQYVLLSLLQQQIDFNAATVRFAQRLEGELLELRALSQGLAPDDAERDRAGVDLRRDLGALRVVVHQQQRRLEDAARDLAIAQEEVRLLLRRVEQDRHPSVAPSGPAETPAAMPTRPAIDYYRFESRFRGASDQVREHQRQYLPAFMDASNVLDIGCGRGEFIELLRNAGVSSSGVDLDGDMVAACRAKGLEVTQVDALGYLRAQEDGSIGGAFTAQLVEHLESGVLVELVDLLGKKLRPRAPLVIETINPQCLLAASSHFLIDLSHIRLVHPETLRFLLEEAGFQGIEVRYTSPVPEAVQLQGMPWPKDDGPLDAMAATHNRNMAKLNAFLYGYQDYAVVATRSNE